MLDKRSRLNNIYGMAVKLYADTDMSLRDIAEKSGVTPGALSAYLRRYCRELVLKRHNIDVGEKDPKTVKIMAAGQQSINAHAKYKDAVQACDNMNHIELNMSQIARMFNLSGTGLTNFMRVHYPEILIRRDNIRKRLGIIDNNHHGVRKESQQLYAEAVELYSSTDLSLPEIAEKC
ncbi:MAG: hypothetical protein Q4D41_09185, partial [Prevotellaceae bacterium]|nr:hypothetical protein [Prevotellaceae bacterium]